MRPLRPSWRAIATTRSDSRRAPTLGSPGRRLCSLGLEAPEPTAQLRPCAVAMATPGRSARDARRGTRDRRSARRRSTGSLRHSRTTGRRRGARGGPAERGGCLPLHDLVDTRQDAHVCHGPTFARSVDPGAVPRGYQTLCGAGDAQHPSTSGKIIPLSSSARRSGPGRSPSRATRGTYRSYPLRLSRCNTAESFNVAPPNGDTVPVQRGHRSRLTGTPLQLTGTPLPATPVLSTAAPSLPRSKLLLARLFEHGQLTLICWT